MDFVSGQFATVGGGSPGVRLTRAGFVCTNNSPGSSVDFWRVPINNGPTGGEITLFYFGRITNYVGSQRNLLSYVRNGDEFAHLQANISDQIIAIFRAPPFGGDRDSFVFNSGFNSGGNGGPAALTFDNTNGCKAHFAGKEGSGSGVNSASFTGPVGELRIGHHQSAIGLEQEVSIAALFNRSLVAEEVKEISANPWQLFAPRQIYVPNAAGIALPTLSLSTFKPGSRSSSGWTPRVNAS